MEITKTKLRTVKDALQYAVINATTESETAEFALLLVEVQAEIAEENGTNKC